MALHLPKLLLVVSAALVLPASAWAAEIETVQFDDTVTVDGQKMVLHNVGLMRYRVIFKALVAALYLPPETKSAEVLNDVPKRLEIEYFWAIKAKDIVAAAEEMLKQNLPPETLQALRDEIDYVNSLYPDIKAGDRFELTYVPDVGTELSLNGKSQGVVRGKEFAAAFFAIWLGEKPMDVSLRDQLLKAK